MVYLISLHNYNATCYWGDTTKIGNNFLDV